MSDYTPTKEEVRTAYKAGGGYRWPERGEQFDTWLAAHDAEVREQCAREVYTHLPIILREEAKDGCGWLSDMAGGYEANMVRPTDYGVEVPYGCIDVDHIGDYALSIIEERADSEWNSEDF